MESPEQFAGPAPDPELKEAKGINALVGELDAISIQFTELKRKAREQSMNDNPEMRSTFHEAAELIKNLPETSKSYLDEADLDPEKRQRLESTLNSFSKWAQDAIQAGINKDYPLAIALLLEDHDHSQLDDPNYLDLFIRKLTGEE